MIGQAITRYTKGDNGSKTRASPPAIIQAQEVNLKPVLMLIPAALRILALLLLIASLLESKPLAVSTIPLKQGALQKQSVFVGRLTYKESSKIASQQRGVVDKVHFAVGG